MPNKPLRPLTRISQAGLPSPIPQFGLHASNPPVFHASTLIFRDFDEARARRKAFFEKGRPGYGIGGTDLHHALEDLLAELEGGVGAKLQASGLASITLALLAFLRKGDHLLVTDAVYGPCREFCDSLVVNFGVEVEYYPPVGVSDLEKRLKSNTRMIWLESPGSVTFEIQDLAAIADLARSRGIVTAVDNTWATPLGCQPLSFGIDLSVHALTKYAAGHSDLLAGGVIYNERAKSAIEAANRFLGHHLAPDDAFLCLRGMRSLSARLDQQARSALEVARFLEERSEVVRMLHPALESHPQARSFAAQFSRPTALFSCQLRPEHSLKEVEALAERLRLFGIGYSWGGFESLVMVYNYADLKRRFEGNADPRPVFRLSIGLEDPADLIDDLAQALEGLSP